MRTAFILTVVVLTGTGGELSITHAMKRIGEVRLKGFTESTEIFLARQRREE